MTRDERYVRMIHTAQWLRLRKQKLEANPLCECCHERGLYTPATEVHHRIPVESAMDTVGMQRLMFNYSNLESLCHACHVDRHAALRSHSKEAMRKHNDKRNEEFKKKFM